MYFMLIINSCLHKDKEGKGSFGSHWEYGEAHSLGASTNSVGYPSLGKRGSATLQPWTIFRLDELDHMIVQLGSMASKIKGKTREKKTYLVWYVTRHADEAEQDAWSDVVTCEATMLSSPATSPYVQPIFVKANSNDLEEGQLIWAEYVSSLQPEPMTRPRYQLSYQFRFISHH